MAWHWPAAVTRGHRHCGSPTRSILSRRQRRLPHLGCGWAGLVGLAAGAALLIGVLTPIAGVVLGLGAIGIGFSILAAPSPNLFDAKIDSRFSRHHRRCGRVPGTGRVFFGCPPVRPPRNHYSFPVQILTRPCDSRIPRSRYLNWPREWYSKNLPYRDDSFASLAQSKSSKATDGQIEKRRITGLWQPWQPQCLPLGESSLDRKASWSAPAPVCGGR